MRPGFLLVALVLLAPGGCAPRQALTTWGYSHWYREGGGEMGAFEDQRQICLQKIGSSQDPAAVLPNSPEEARYVACMNGAGWCTTTFACQKPGG
jgi:hypothetical protein